MYSYYCYCYCFILLVDVLNQISLVCNTNIVIKMFSRLSMNPSLPSYFRVLAEPANHIDISIKKTGFNAHRKRVYIQHNVKLDTQTSLFIDLVIYHVPARMSIKAKVILARHQLSVAAAQACFSNVANN